MRKECWKGCRENVTFVHCWYRYKLVQSLWKQYAGSSKKLKIELPYAIKLVNPKGNQPWIFIARSDAEAETPVFWPPDAKNWLIGKDPDAGKDRRQEEKGTTEDEMVGWHHRLNGHEFEQASGIGDGPGSLACFSSWGHNWVTELNDPAIPLLDLYMQRKLNQYLEDICSPPCSLQHCNSQQTEMEIA